jgi:hypothetical protein
MPLNSLEQQALDRMGRMYASFDNRPPRPTHDGRPDPPAPPQPAPPQPEPPKPEPPKPEPSDPPAGKPPGFLDLLLEDKEQSLVLLLLIILLKDGADLHTILALLYILM